MAESYPPSFFDSLLKAVRRLAAETRYASDAVEWLEETFQLGTSGWFSLGPIVPPGSDSYGYASPIRTTLPSHVEYVHASLHCLVPRHVMLVACFVLDDLGSCASEEILRRSFRSYTIERKDSTTIHGPANQKREAVRASRDQQLADLATLLRHEMPGLFASDVRPFPSIEFWTTKERTPFNDDRSEPRSSLHDFIRLLGWVVWTNVWRGPHSLTLREAPLSGDDLDGGSRNLQLVVREDALAASKDFNAYGGPTREAYVNWLDDLIHPLTSISALTETFRFYDSELLASMRHLRDAQETPLRRRVSATAAVQEQLLRHHADVDVVARGVAVWGDHLLPMLKRHTIDFERWSPLPRADALPTESSPHRKRVPGFDWLTRLARRTERAKPPDGVPDPRKRDTWLETQARTIAAQAERVVSGSREITEVVRAMSEMSSAQASLRLQRQVAVLTWVLAAIGVATLMVVIVK
jgi:hypothetical protein